MKQFNSPLFILMAMLAAAGFGAAGYAWYRSAESVSPKSSAPIVEASTQNSKDPFPAFTVHAGKTDESGEPLTNARLCIQKSTNCFSLASVDTKSKVRYFFGLDPTAQRIPGTSLVFFSGRFYGGGSGTLDSMSILRYSSDGKIVNVLPSVELSDGGDREFWKLVDVSSMPIFATAQAIWGEGEAHFDDHFYSVSAYLFDQKTHRYVRKVQYNTAAKYSGDPDQDSGSVLEPEKATVMTKLNDLELTHQSQSLQPKDAPQGGVLTAQDSEEALAHKLGVCVLPKAQYGHYSSFDGGKSALSLSEECPEDTVKFEDHCESTGTSKKECAAQLLIFMQLAMKSFGK